MIKPEGRESEKKITSITELITVQDKTIKQADIKRLFQIRQVPRFSISDLQQSYLFLKNETFHRMVTILDQWNSKISKQEQSSTCRAQFFRNQFIFSSLKSILVQNTNVERNLQRLEQWFLKNTHEQMITVNPKTRLNSQIDDDWEIRKTYRTNMPMELHNYQRRQLTARANTQQKKPARFNKMNDDQVHQQKQISTRRLMTTWAQYKFCQEKERRKRQQQQVNYEIFDWKKSKSRFQQIISKNYYKHKFSTSGKWKEQLKNQILGKNGVEYLIQRNNNLEQIKLVKIKRKVYGRKKADQENISGRICHKQNSIFSIDGVSLASNPFDIKGKGNRKMKRKAK